MTDHAGQQDVLSEEEHQDVLHRLILPAATRNAVPQKRPVVVVVSGPPGAGKTEVSDLVQAALARRGGAVRICRDLYKAPHRHYPALLREDVRTAGVRVRPDTIRWQDEVEEYVRTHRLDAVVESALASEQEFRAVSAAYRSSGHRIEVVAIATAEALAQLGVLDRFLAGEFRYVSWENQDTCTAGMLRTLAMIEKEQLADRVSVVRRDMDPVYDNELTRGGNWARSVAAATTARAEQLRPWSAKQTRIFRRELTRAEVLVHDERLPADARLAVSRDTERAAAAAEPVRRIAQPLPGSPGTGYHRLSTAEHRWAFDELIAPVHLRRAKFRPDPVVVYLVGEYGAGQLMAGRMVRRAMRPRPVRIEPDRLRGAHPDHFQLVTDSPRIADELVRPDVEEWQTVAEAYVREQRSDATIEADYLNVDDFRLSAARFARADYRIEVVALAGRAADSRQSTFVRHARALELDVMTTLPTQAAHARASRVAAEVVEAAAADPDIASVTVLDADLQALGRDRAAPWALTAESLRPYTEREAARFHSVQRALHGVLPRMREEIEGLAVQARPLMPAGWQARPVEHRPGPARPLLPAASLRPA
ncbi:zeta toxin family protein [Streptomyces sp. LHD-70]|uniref:zeta toxin family protein n=1 Tax=Streptomyces sp. LHD-70 TaxID=3072140 RepID=UPI00280E59DB|nr:zeta toxin family protein [Streptomyces sp. LHD-70]MDQ8707578.1 zeta toxin family protein [Streptomyces sp. LHD-70]